MGNRENRSRFEAALRHGRGRLAARSRARGGSARESRRGVLLLVVLSMLVLFMLIGTAFLMSSSQMQKAANVEAKSERLNKSATKRLDSALLQVLRDTENPHSVVRYHSLLRDLYGTDGFQGIVYSPESMDLTTALGQVTRYADGKVGNSAAPLDPTNGQFIDIYVTAGGYVGIDYTQNYNGTTNPLDLRNVLKLDRNVYGEPQPYPLPLTKGYFNGCLLTITSGPAAGATARILDYNYIGELKAATTAQPPTTATRLFRFRVMAFHRADGQPLTVNQNAARAPEIIELAGEPGVSSPATFIVNGRAFSGTGVGYNPLAATGQPRLSAVQLFQVPNGYIGAETGADAELRFV